MTGAWVHNNCALRDVCTYPIKFSMYVAVSVAALILFQRFLPHETINSFLLKLNFIILSMLASVHMRINFALILLEEL